MLFVSPNGTLFFQFCTKSIPLAVYFICKVNLARKGIPMIDTAEAAHRLGVSRRRVLALIEAGDIAAERLGRTWMVDERSVERRLASPKLKGRPKLGQKNLMSLKSCTLMNRNHEVLDFTYDAQRKTASIDKTHPDVAWAPPGIFQEGRQPNPIDLADWIRRRYMPPLRPESQRLMKLAGVTTVDELMFGSLGLNLSDQYWFRPEGTTLDWHDVNFFENGYSHDPAAPLRTPDSSTPGALEKRWERIEGVDYLVKGASTAERREPYNEVLATRLAKRLLSDDEYIPYTLVEREGLACSACPTFATEETEFVSAADVAVFAGISLGRDLYRSYADACERLGIADARVRLAKMIVFDHVSANFDRHLGNFGLMRTVESLDGWRMAPLFDNGAAFFSRATMAELQRARYTWASNPFEEYPSRQLARVEDLSWYDPQMLEGFFEEVEETLLKNTALPEGFAERAAHHVQRNIDAVDDVAAERAALYAGF